MSFITNHVAVASLSFPFILFSGCCLVKWNNTVFTLLTPQSVPSATLESAERTVPLPLSHHSVPQSCYFNKRTNVTLKVMPTTVDSKSTCNTQRLSCHTFSFIFCYSFCKRMLVDGSLPTPLSLQNFVRFPRRANSCYKFILPNGKRYCQSDGVSCAGNATKRPKGAIFKTVFNPV